MARVDAGRSEQYFGREGREGRRMSGQGAFGGLVDEIIGGDRTRGHSRSGTKVQSKSVAREVK